MSKIEKMTENGGYVIDVQPAKKKVYMDVVGAFTTEQAEQFQYDYQQKIGSISTINYLLEIDCKDFEVIDEKMLPKLMHSFKLYKASEFKKIEFLISNNIEIRKQLESVAETADLSNYEIIDA
ncbi:hypothetical protein MUN88_00515 [Gracilibacillus caseinilyticus]|uniref:STAS domain-containing protein n=1 Tax=Gracilibacillus caseinilyticus TaxID=2932256 RepID=A0ABY4EW88_9BACI|nr:hypothetical protein [Gracilibacillus caseinilyticus]UOQ48681.1 hypothetical protein MUN88_00515 [Gracilibacillus caseinilyticus]